ncbi:BMC domain-containing protein [Pelagicoccus sp. NFK12]|uniref:BMC domain-containing protein n=1 Tax=Pelagicoccus enzymogenes TaxID=2773457 RepID=A0A927FB96_9BACT|nr:BMC domain-containing protein [Pelagicoccus enzymogenes]MBD5781928.1 BMC domain-containing protein [Pelagicoccus enzymogenes]MDQ8196686.1 BMC domain-containing protein [Pelagicoccus enzymogenes]
MKQAIGILETKGLTALITGTDAMLKSADVQITGPVKNVGSAMVSVTVEGNVAAVKAAIESGVEAAQAVGEVLSAHVIARPSESLASVIPQAPAAKSRASK